MYIVAHRPWTPQVRPGPIVNLTETLCCSDVRVRLAGTYLGYAYAGTAIGDETDKLGALDLRTGRAVRPVKLRPNSEGPDPEIDTYWFIRAFDVTHRGALVWAQRQRNDDGSYGSTMQVRATDGRRHVERIVDEGDIDPASIRVSRDHPYASWVEDGVRVQVRLRTR